MYLMAIGKRIRTRRKPKAATADIVSLAPNVERIPRKWRKQYRRLAELRQHLVSEQIHLAKDALDEKPTYSTHMADAGTDNFDRDFALGMLSSEQDALYEIDQAIERIRDGNYGICELTGKRIEAKRLEAIPWARFTAAVEKRLEREGALKQSRLGPRETVHRQEPEVPADTEEAA